MSNKRRSEEIIRALESRAPRAPAAGLDANVVAAWVEGRLAERDSAALETLLAADPELLQALLETRQPAAREIDELEARRIVAALPLSKSPITQQPARPRAWRRRAQWAAAAVIVLGCGLQGAWTGSKLALAAAYVDAAALRAELAAVGGLGGAGL